MHNPDFPRMHFPHMSKLGGFCFDISLVVHLFVRWLPWVQLFIHSLQPAFLVCLIPIRYLKSSFGDLVSEFILGVPNTDLAGPLSTVQGGSQWHRGGYRCALGPFPAQKETKTADPAPIPTLKYHALSTGAQTELALTEGAGEQSCQGRLCTLPRSTFDLTVYHRARFRKVAISTVEFSLAIQVRWLRLESLLQLKDKGRNPIKISWLRQCKEHVILKI